MSLRSEAVDQVCRDWDKKVLFNSTWMGVNAVKNPCDAWVYQEIIWQLKPEVIIETGTYKGGGAIFFASMMDMMGINGHVYSMDVREYGDLPQHPKVTYMQINSVQELPLRELKAKIQGKNILVVLDSNHDTDHVAKELEMYGPIVPPGGYMIVEDTWWNPDEGGPWPAVQKYLKTHPEFMVDKTKEPYGMTNNPNGFLKRVQ